MSVDHSQVVKVELRTVPAASAFRHILCSAPLVASIQLRYPEGRNM